MRLGLTLGYWGLGLTADEQLALRARGRGRRLRLRLGRRGLRLGRRHRAGLARRPDRAHQARRGDPPDAGALAGDDGDDRRDARPPLGRPLHPRARHVRARRWPRAGTASASASSSLRTREYVEIVRKALARERLDLRRRHLQAAAARRARQGAQADDRARCRSGSRSTSPRSARRTRSWPARSPTAGCRSSSRPSTSTTRARCSRRAPPAPGRSLDGSSTSRPTVQVSIDDDVDRARDAMRPFLALYVGGMGSREKNFYNALVQRYGFDDAAQEIQDLYLDGKKEEAAAAIPAELIDMVTLVRPARPGEGAARGLPRRRRRHADRVADGLRPRAAQAHDPRARGDALSAGRAASCSPPSATPGTPSRRSRWARELAARGHDVTLETWSKWREHAEREGMRFAPAPEYQVFPTRGRPLKPYAAAVRASAETRRLIRDVDPEVVVADILTVAAALAAELEGRPWATLVPHVLPDGRARLPGLRGGRRLPAHAAGRAALAARPPAADARRAAGARASSTRRARASASARSSTCTAASRASSRWSPPSPSSSTRAASRSRGCASPGRCSGSSPTARSSCRPATTRSCWSRRAPPRTPSTGCCAPRSTGWPASRCACWRPPTGAPPERPLDVPANARLVDWVSYARTMPRCAAVVCHAGHGTVARALACGRAGGGLPARRRHGRERGPAALGRPRRVAAAPLPHRARRAPGGAAPARRSRLRRARRARARLVRAPRRGRGRGDAVEAARPAIALCRGDAARRSVARVTRPPSLWIDREGTRDPDAGPFSSARWRRQALRGRGPPAGAGGAGGSGAPAGPAAAAPPGAGRGARGRARRAGAVGASPFSTAATTARLLPAAGRRPPRAHPGRPRLRVGRPGRGLGAGRVGVAAPASSCAATARSSPTPTSSATPRPPRCASATAAGWSRPRCSARDPSSDLAALRVDPGSAGRCARCAGRLGQGARGRRGGRDRPPVRPRPDRHRRDRLRASGARSRPPTASRSTR